MGDKWVSVWWKRFHDEHHQSGNHTRPMLKHGVVIQIPCHWCQERHDDLSTQEKADDKQFDPAKTGG